MIFELIKRRYDSEWNRVKDLESKANNLIGFVSIIVGLLLGSGTFKLSAALLYSLVSIPYFLGVGILLVSIEFALGAVRVRRYGALPDVRDLLDKYALEPYNKTLLTILGNTMIIRQVV